MSAWIRLMLQEIDQKQAEAAEAEEEARRRAATPEAALATEPGASRKAAATR